MKLIAKLRSRSGESFTELLCAIVIMSLGMALLAGMVSSASGLNQRAAAKDAQLYDGLASAELKDSVIGEPETLSIILTPTTGDPVILEFDGVTYYGLEDEICAYYTEVDDG